MSLCSALFRREIIFNTEGKVKVYCPDDVTVFEDFAFICSYLSLCTGYVEVLPFRGYFYCKQPGSFRVHTAGEIKKALLPILDAGRRIKDDDFIADRLQYTFRFMAFWYEETFRNSKHDFSPACENWKICMNELERYADVYMKADNVAFYKKVAMWIVRNHPEFGRVLVKMAGSLFIRFQSYFNKPEQEL